MPIIIYMGVVTPLMGSLSLDGYDFHFLIALKETLTFLWSSNSVLQYSGIDVEQCIDTVYVYESAES